MSQAGVWTEPSPTSDGFSVPVSPVAQPPPGSFLTPSEKVRRTRQASLDSTLAILLKRVRNETPWPPSTCAAGGRNWYCNPRSRSGLGARSRQGKLSLQTRAPPRSRPPVVRSPALHPAVPRPVSKARPSRRIKCRPPCPGSSMRAWTWSQSGTGWATPMSRRSASVPNAAVLGADGDRIVCRIDCRAHRNRQEVEHLAGRVIQPRTTRRVLSDCTCWKWSPT